MKIAVLGHFGVGLSMLNGQTVKTKNLVDGIEKNTDIQVVKIDSHGWIKKPLALLRQIKMAFKECDIVIMLPAHNGVQVFSYILRYYKYFYQKKIIYDVIGGWLPAFLTKKKLLSKTLKAFDGLWVETSTMKQALEAQGFENISVIPNFKELAPLAESELVYPTGAPYRLCTFSRVMKEKGIETAVEAVKSVNAQLGYTAYNLDIYGQVDVGQKEWFEDLQASFPDYVQYRGCVDSDRSVEVLKDYFALLFPTHFYTEGIPGTIIDAYAAGIPVISARWESFTDVVNQGSTGIGYEFDCKDSLVSILLAIEVDSAKIVDMKKKCLKKAEMYAPENVLRMVLSAFGN